MKYRLYKQKYAPGTLLYRGNYVLLDENNWYFSVTSMGSNNRKQVFASVKELLDCIKSGVFIPIEPAHWISNSLRDAKTIIHLDNIEPEYLQNELIHLIIVE